MLIGIIFIVIFRLPSCQKMKKNKLIIENKKINFLSRTVYNHIYVLILLF